MGSGCFKAKKCSNDIEPVQPLTSADSESRSAASSDLGLKLAPVTQAIGKSSTPGASTLEEVLDAFGTAALPEEVGCWFEQDWLPRSSAKQRASLQTLLKRVAEHALDAKIVEAEKELSRAGEQGSNFEHVCGLAERHLKLETDRHGSLAAMALVAGSTARRECAEREDKATMCIVPAFDRIVMLFRRALLADPAAGGSAAGRLQRWRELRAETGIPALEHQLVLLSYPAKASLLGLLLLPHEAKLSQVIVNRDGCVLLSAAEQLPNGGACVLSPYFESATGTKSVQGRRVEGGEGHGPRKEFFAAVSTDATRSAGNGQPPPLFTFHRGAGQHWFSAYAADLDESPRAEDQRSRLHCFGKVLALAVANHCKLSFTLPILFFRLLLRPPEGGEPSVALEHVASLDSSLHVSLKKCLKMNNAKFKALKEIEGHPEDLNREDYVAQQVANIMCPEAMKEVRRGFWEMAGDSTNWRDVAAGDLRQIVCPTYSADEDLNIRHIFEVVIEDEMAEDPVFVGAFWAVVDALSLEEKRRFLLFVTGVEAPPEPGSEQLLIQLPFSAFSVEEHAAMLEKLPQAHTCSNLLELPNYPEALRETGKVTEAQGTAAMENELKKLLDFKLRQAINETGGYELDAVDDPAECSSLSSSIVVSPFKPPGVVEEAPPPPFAVAVARRPPLGPHAEMSRGGGPATAAAEVVTIGAASGAEPGRKLHAAVHAAAPAEQDFAAFLEALQKQPGASPNPLEEQTRPGNIDNLIEELDQVMSIE